MNLDLLTGLLLTGAVLLGIGYAVRELAGDALMSFFSEHTSRTADDPHKRLIGEHGEVLGPSSEGTIRVRIGIERWNARVEAEDGTLPAGTAVRVAGVDGLTLRVEPLADE